MAGTESVVDGKEDVGMFADSRHSFSSKQVRRSGMIFGDDFVVTPDQEKDDQELLSQIDIEVKAMQPPKEPADGAAETNSTENARPRRPPPPRPVTETHTGSNIPSIAKLEKEYSDIARFRIFQMAGDDLSGRPVIAFSACRLPVRDLIDHQRLSEFVKATLKQYVESDYTIVYFHYGLNSQNKPSYGWLLQVYRSLDRNFKKNIKALLIVHSTSFIKFVYSCISPFLSQKFGKKIHYVNTLDELAPHLRLDQLDIPVEVRKHDEQILAKLKNKTTTTGSAFHVPLQLPATQQFGIPLKKLREATGEPIPLVVKTVVEFLRKNALETEGIFRRSPQSVTIKEFTERFNRGETVEFSTDDVHVPAVLLKKFLRELPEPLLTFKLYEESMDISALTEEQRIAEMKTLVRELPEENYTTLEYILQFLSEVIDHTQENRMTSGSLAIIFGPNLLWSPSATSSLTAMSKTNTFTKVLIEHWKVIYDVDATN